MKTTKNTEKFVVFHNPTQKGIFVNTHCDFKGSAEEAKEYATQHNYGGGVEAFICSHKGKAIYQTL